MKTCEWCGNKFIPKNTTPWQRFCCIECSRHSLKSHKQSPVPTIVYTKCEWCRKSIEVSSWFPHKRFCSKLCKGAASHHRHLEWGRHYSYVHRSEISIRNSRHYLANIDKQSEYQHRYDAEHSEEHMARNQNRRARKLSAPGSGITAEQMQMLMQDTDNRCVYCGTKSDHLTIDHVVPLISGGAHDISNAVPACQHCNSSKGTKSLLMFLYQSHLLIPVVVCHTRNETVPYPIHDLLQFPFPDCASDTTGKYPIPVFSTSCKSFHAGPEQ